MNTKGEKRRKALIKEISDVIQNVLKDPRITGIISITDVELSADYRYAKVFVSVFGDQEKKDKIMDALADASLAIRKEVSKRIRMHHVPELNFHLDESLEKGKRITDLLDKISKGEA